MHVAAVAVRALLTEGAAIGGAGSGLPSTPQGRPASMRCMVAEETNISSCLQETSCCCCHEQYRMRNSLAAVAEGRCGGLVMRVTQRHNLLEITYFRLRPTSNLLLAAIPDQPVT